MDGIETPATSPTFVGEAESLSRLRLSRDAAMHAANVAVRDATRLTRLLTAINDSGELDALLERILLTLSELFAAEVVVLLDPAGTGSYVPLSSIGLPEDLASLPFSGASEDNVALTMREESPLLINDAAADATVDAQLRELELGSVIYLPVTASHAARGVLILGRCAAEPFAFADVGLLTAMAYRIGLAVEQAQRRAQLERIVRSEHDFGIDLEAEAVARHTVDAFPALIGADSALMVFLTEDGGIRKRLDKGLTMLSDADLSQVVRHLLDDTRIPEFASHAETISLGSDAESLTAGPVERAMMAVPMGRGHLDGLLLGFRTLPTPFDPDMHTIAMLYGGQCSTMIENAHLYQTVRSELSDRRRAERALKASEQRLGALIRSVHDLIVVLGPTGTIQFGNPAAAQFWRSKGGDAAWESFWGRICPEHVTTLREIVESLQARPGVTRTCSLCLLTEDGKRHEYDVVLTNLLEEPAVAGIVLTFHDITDRKSYEARLEDQAFHDPLTGLANRAHFHDHLQKALTAPAEQGRPVAVIFLDLDDFKVVNDSLGHDAGDCILTTVARRMKAVLRPADIGARLGGDEFTVLLQSDVSADAARRIALRLLDAIREPIVIGGREVVVGSSFGIALGTSGQDSADDLLRHADVAMYHAKANGKNGCALFDEKLEVIAIKRLEAETELRRALAKDELDVFFQPIVSLSDGRLRGAEALMRWHHPERGLVGPAEFIDVAESTGLIVEAGQRVFEKAFEWLRHWRLTHGVDLPLHLNLSPRQLASSAFTDMLMTASQRFGVVANTIALEITENTLITNREPAIAMVERLHEHGFRLAIDDFGTGYSSLSYIKKLPVDVLKIDRSFTHSVATDPRDEAIVRNIVSLTEALGISLVVEGVETEEQRDLLHSMGCVSAQGFLFAPALPGEAFEKLLPLKAGQGRASKLPLGQIGANGR